jgi:single-strand DNA-binding protein
MSARGGIPTWAVGNVGKDAEFKTVGSKNTERLTFSIAVKRSTGRDSEDATDWFECVIWSGFAKALKGRIKKGDRLFVAGDLGINKYTDNNNVERTSMRLTVNALEFCAAWPDPDGGSGGDSGGFDDDYAPPNF